MPSELDTLLTAIGERAGDMRSSLQSFDPRRLHEWGATLAHFQHLSKQLELLNDRASDGLLALQLALPAEISHEQINAIPTLLSTRLDKEHEDALAQLEAKAGQASLAGERATADDIEEHNRRLEAASKHLQERSAALDLPSARGAAVAQAGSAPAGSAAASSAARGGASTTEHAASPPAVQAETARALFAALRTGEGLRLSQSDQAKRQRT